MAFFSLIFVLMTSYKLLKILPCVFILFISADIYAQGCSDAGLCTAGGMKHTQNENEKTFTANFQYGKGEQNVNISSIQLEYRQLIKNKWAFQIKLPFVFTSGNLGNTSALGDLSLVGSYKPQSDKSWQSEFNVGFKLPTGRTDLLKNQLTGLTAPMPYQSGLGTFDVLLGASIAHKKGWFFATGVQLPLIQNNNNVFDTSIGSFTQEQRAYFSSTKLIRRPDIVARLEKTFSYKEKLRFQLGFIPIYHLGNDSYTEFSGNREKITLTGSEGLTLNMSSGVTYKLKDNLQVSIRYSQPFIVRKVRPDGLTRHYVFGFELSYGL